MIKITNWISYRIKLVRYNNDNSLIMSVILFWIISGLINRLFIPLYHLEVPYKVPPIKNFPENLGCSQNLFCHTHQLPTMIYLRMYSIQKMSIDPIFFIIRAIDVRFIRSWLVNFISDNLILRVNSGEVEITAIVL